MNEIRLVFKKITHSNKTEIMSCTICVSKDVTHVFVDTEWFNKNVLEIFPSNESVGILFF